MEEGEENGSRLLRLKGHFHFLPTSQGIKSVAPAALLCVCGAGHWEAQSLALCEYEVQTSEFFFYKGEGKEGHTPVHDSPSSCICGNSVATGLITSLIAGTGCLIQTIQMKGLFWLQRISRQSCQGKHHVRKGSVGVWGVGGENLIVPSHLGGSWRRALRPMRIQ